MLSAAMGGSARLSQPDVRSPMYTNPEQRDDPSVRLSHPDMRKLLSNPSEKESYKHPVAHLARAPFASIAEDEMKDQLQIGRAPIASLDCMEEFQGCGGDHVSTRSDSQALVSRQSSIASTLKYKPLGKSGLRVSQLGLGTWVTFSPLVSEETAEEIVTVAYEAGINLFDLSEAYSGGRAEIQLGNILKKKGWRRSSYHVITKVYWNSKGDERGLSRKHIIESVKSSLERLQLDYIDVIIIHRADDMCPMEEVVRAASHCIDQGWCMYWGTSRWSAVEIMEAWTNCRQFNCITPIVEQSEYHLFCRSKTELYLPEIYNKIGVGTMAWSPLAIGLISSKMDDGMPVFTRQSFKASTPSSRFHEAASSGDVTTMLTLMTEGGIDVDIADDRERTALHVAADRGQLPAVLFLIEKGCNVNQTDSGRRTALHYAVEVCAVEVVAALLEGGAAADVRERARGRTPLHLATVTNSLEILKLLLKPLLEDPWHARSVLKVADKDGLTLLHLAAHGGLQEATQILISAGAEVNITDQAGYTPMHAAILSRQRKEKICSSLLELLLDSGGDLQSAGGAEFATLPHAAASVGCTRCLGVLNSRGADLDCKDSSGRTPLHFAVEYEHPETVSFLLGRNADVEAQDKRANRPLHYAIGTDSPRLVASVLEASPQRDARDRDGRTYFQHAVERRKYRALAVLAKHGITAVPDDQPAMHYCASAGSQAAVEVLLENDHDVNATDAQGRTPMHQAICAGHESLVNFLLSSGGSIRRADKNGATPLHYGVRWGGSDALLRRLVKGGSVAAVDRLGRTPLHYAASKSSVMSDMYILINNGAPLNTQDNRGLTPLHLASRLGNESLVRILLDNNARHDILDVDNFLPIDHAKEKGHICIINRLESYAAKKEREKDPRFGLYTRRTDEDEVLIQSRYKTNIPWYGSGKKGSDSPEL